MKKTLSLLIAILSVSVAIAGNWTKIQPQKPDRTNIQLVKSNATSDIVKFNLNAYKLLRTETPRGTAFTISSPDASPMLQAGNPDLPKISQSLIIPNQGNSNIEVLSSDYIELTNIDIAPSKGTIYRNQNPEDVAYTYSKVYNQDAFFPQALASVNEPYIMRDVRGQTINIYPFAYNPVQKVLRIYTDITVKLTYNKEQGVNELNKRNLTFDDDFNKIYQRQFLNYSQERYTPLEEGTPGRMLIISYGPFMDEMAPFVTWKREKGIETEIVDVAEIGNVDAIKSYIADEYNGNKGLNYVVLVGDAEQIPTTETGDDSDNEYVYLSGNDHYADCFIGRISAESGSEVTRQVNKIIAYERDFDTNNAWLENAFCSASNQGGSSGDDGESDEQHMANIATDLENYGYTVTHVNENGGSNPQITTAFNNGISVGCYVGHGGDTEWVNTHYSNTEVNTLTNTGKYPFIFSVACVNGNFKNQTCFAEAWLRAKDDSNNPTGAVGFLGSTINQSWADPMDAQDEMVDILVESYENNIKRTYGGIAFNGIFHMLDEYASASGPSMADTWTLFGEPSLMVRTKNPSEMTISHPTALVLGSTTCDVDCDVEGALIAITTEIEGETKILGTAYSNGGTTTVNITETETPGTAKITVTAFNKVTYQATIDIIVPQGPYVVLNTMVIDDATANNDGILNNNESALLDVTLENIGVDASNGVNVELTTTSTKLSITDNTEDFGDITSNNTVSKDNAFAINLEDGIEDQTVIPLSFNITDVDNNTWSSNKSITINAPKLAIDFVTIDDNATGNGNGHLDPGETATITFAAQNTGHNEAVEGEMTATITTNGSFTENTMTVPINAANGSENINYTIEVNSNTAIGDQILVTVTYTSGAYTVTQEFSFSIGLQIEDWESGDMESYNWENETPNTPWTIVSNEVYEGDYALKSGSATNASSILRIDINVLSNDTIKFYKKVSCEQEYWGGTMYDFLEFTIDNTEKGKWCGEIDWSQESYPVSVGQHIFTWAYTKDDMYDAGQDCAWLDNIKLPPHESANIIVQTTTNVEEFEFSLTPNPAAEYAFVNFNLTEKAHISIEIIDMQGHIIENIYNEESPEGTYRIAYDVNHIPNGMYIVRLTTGKSVHTERLIIAK